MTEIILSPFAPGYVKMRESAMIPASVLWGIRWDVSLKARIGPS